MRPLLLTILSLFLAAPQEAEISSSAAARYRDCTALVARNPGEALETSSAWRDQGGGVAASHCLALALIALERYEAGAKLLETTIERIRAGRLGLESGLNITPTLVAQLHAQAGNAWALAGAPENAYTALSAALGELAANDPQALEILIDRALTLAALEDYEAMVADLDRALLMAPDRGEIYLYRGIARRHLEDYEAALGDLAAAAVRLPESAAVALERGNVLSLTGNIDGARAAWVEAATLDEDGANGAAARSNLEALELDQEGE